MEALQASEARRFGKYTLVAKLATGGMAEIFLARLHGDGGFEKLVCIKRILPHLAKDPQFVSMFLDEARVAARISHPNVCQVFELGEWQRQYYIAMEYLEGVPLSVFRRTDFYPVPPDPRLVAGFAVQACEGLHHAHQLKRADGELLGVVHRDMSPQNLFATTDGIVKVLDFGIAKVQDANSKTSTGAVKGTYAYMAPEQLRNEKIDRRVDVWAIGVVLWETLAQTHLFKRDTEFLTFEAITKLPIPNICDIRPDVPPLFGDTIARALSRNPDDRFASARALGEAIAQAVGPLGGALTPAGISEEVGESFQAALAEQRTLLRIAREGGQFDLETSSPLVGHGSRISQTPVSNIQRRAEEAQAEVAHYAAQNAVQNALDSLDQSDQRRGRPGSDGAFTPAPSRGPAQRAASRDSLDSVLEGLPDAGSQRRSHPMAAQADPRAAARSQPYNIAPAEWTRGDPTPTPAPHAPMPVAPVRASRLPWIIAIISVAAAATTGILLYTKLSEKKTAAAAEQAAPAIVMNESPAAAPAPVAPAPPVQEPVPTRLADPVETPAEPTVDKPVAEPVTQPPDEPTPIAEPLHPKKVEKKPPPRPVKVEPKIEPKIEPKVEVRAPPPAGPPGTITIDSAPVYAVIYVDGKKLGETPLVNIKLSPGKHAVRAVSPSGATKNLSITIESGKSAPVRKISW
jgi:serine/threonine-protein kinase